MVDICYKALGEVGGPASQCCQGPFSILQQTLTFSVFLLLQYDEHLTQLEKDISAVNKAVLEEADLESFGPTISQPCMPRVRLLAKALFSGTLFWHQGLWLQFGVVAAAGIMYVLLSDSTLPMLFCFIRFLSHTSMLGLVALGDHLAGKEPIGQLGPSWLL